LHNDITASLQAYEPHLTVTVKLMDNDNELRFKLLARTPIRKLMSYVCDRWGSRPTETRFFYDGGRLNPEDTASSVYGDIDGWIVVGILKYL
jgi:hypothetical protein